MRTLVALTAIVASAVVLGGSLAACGTVNGPSPGDGTPGDPDAAPGGGDGAALRFSDTRYGFGDMTVGQASFPFSAKITNAGSAPVGPLSVHLAGANAEDFAVDAAACNSHTLGTGTDCAVTVTFAPKAAGARAASLVVEVGAVSATLELTGNGLTPGALTIAPAPQQFDDTAIGASSAEIDFTITNSGDTALDAPALTAGNNFVVTPTNCPDRLGPKAVCKVKVAFKPTTGGAHVTALTAKSGDQTGTAAIRGTGHGTLVVKRAGEALANGSVTAGTINCATGCSLTVAESKVTLSAAVSGAATKFTGWSPICGADATCEVPITAARTEVTASFAFIRHDLTVSTSGTAGSITSTDGFNCSGTSGTCTKTYVHGDSVVLTAKDGANSTFDRWTGACEGVAGRTCTVAVNDVRSAGAVFKAQFTLEVTLSGSAIDVTVNVQGQTACRRATCEYHYTTPDVVKLTATGSGDSRFKNWAGSCSGTACTVTMSANRSVIAVFEATGNVTAPAPTH